MCRYYHSAGTTYDTFLRPCNSLLDNTQGESLVSGNWIGLNSFSASGRAMRVHMAHTVDPLVCYVHGHPFTAQLRPTEPPLCRSLMSS